MFRAGNTSTVEASVREAVKSTFEPLPKPGGAAYSTKTTPQANPAYRETPLRTTRKGSRLNQIIEESQDAEVHMGHGLPNLPSADEERLGEEGAEDEVDDDEDGEGEDNKGEGEKRIDGDEDGE